MTWPLAQFIWPHGYMMYCCCLSKRNTIYVHLEHAADHVFLFFLRRNIYPTDWSEMVTFKQQKNLIFGACGLFFCVIALYTLRTALSLRWRLMADVFIYAARTNRLQLQATRSFGEITRHQRGSPFLINAVYYSSLSLSLSAAVCE